jgi:glc operon protein GlcG
MFTKPALSLEDAKTVAAAVVAEAERRKLKIVLAIVDDGGHLLYFERRDGCRLGALYSATAKAYTSALYRRSTKVYDDALAGGTTMLLAMPNMVPVEGGTPLYHSGGCVGAIGISGATANEDGELGLVAAKALAEL